MARRKRVLDDGETDSSAGRSDDDNIDVDNDPDLRDERELFQDPYRRKRRRKNCKDDAIYGVFGDDSDYEDSSKRGSTSRARTYWTKAPAFVSSEKKLKLEEEDVTLEDRSANEEDYSDHSEPSRPPSPRVLPDEEDDYGEEEVPKPRVGGIGFKSAIAGGNTSFGSGFGFKVGISNKDGTVFLSENNDLSTSHPPTPAPTVPHDGSEPSSSRASPSLDGVLRAQKMGIAFKRKQSKAKERRRGEEKISATRRRIRRRRR